LENCNVTQNESYDRLMALVDTANRLRIRDNRKKIK